MSNKKIFVQIAAYRDPQLLPTLRDCISKAKYPENLVFSITWQHSVDDIWDNLDEYKDDPRFKIRDIDYTLSQGACWARNKLQQFYNDEEYTLQLDSHHRFIQNWDDELIKIYKNLQKKGYKKPLLTGYAPSYEPSTEPEGRVIVPWKMNFDRFGPEGVVHFLPATIENFEKLTEPIPARFYSAHCAFTTGDFVKEVPHDPEFYFHGEEISIAVRAYTWGYDLFHLHKPIIWHEYMRNQQKKHWDDNPSWAEKNEACFQKNRELFGIGDVERRTDLGIYGFGPIRTLADYEQYSGIHFKTRGVQLYTIENNNPPNPPINDCFEYVKSFKKYYKHCIDLYGPSFPETDYDFWVVSFETNSGEVVYRQDADENEIRQLFEISKTDGSWIRLWRSFFSDMPDKWIVWPHSVSKGWCPRIEETLYRG